MDILQIWLSLIEIQSQQKIDNFKKDEERKFISTKFKIFCEDKNIFIQYVAPYIYKKNKLLNIDEGQLS